MRRLSVVIVVAGFLCGCKSWPWNKDRNPADRDVIAPPSNIQPFWPNDNKVPPSPPPPNTPPVDWGTPNSGLNIDAPKLVAPGQDVAIRLEVADPTTTSLRHAVPNNVQILRTEPPARLQGSELVWDLPPGGGSRRDVTVVYRTSAPGPISLKAEAFTATGQRRDAQTTTQVGVGQLGLQLEGPSAAGLQDRITYQVRLSNTSAAAVTNVVLRTELPPGLQHESGNRVLEIPITMMAARDAKSVELPLTITAGGAIRLVVTARGDGGVSTYHERIINVHDAKASLTLNGPTQIVLNKPATWSASIKNEGTTPIRNLQVRMTMPNELRFQQVSPGGRSANNIALWNLESLAPGEQRIVELTALGAAPVARTTLMAAVIGDGIAEQRTDRAMEILGIPLLKLNVTESDNRVEVGRRVLYSAEVRNAGSLPLEDIEVTATVSTNLKPTFGFGPTMNRVDGNRLSFGRIAGLEPGKSIVFQVEVEALTAGDARMTFEARSKSLPTPIMVEEATRVVGP